MARMGGGIVSSPKGRNAGRWLTMLICTTVIVGSTVVAALVPSGKRLGPSSSSSVFESAQRTLAWVGVTSDSLSAVGLTPAECEHVLGVANAYIAEHRVELQALLDDRNRASASLADLETRVQTGTADDVDYSSLDSLRSAAESASTSLENARSIVLAVATDGWSSDRKGTLDRIRINEKFGLSVEYAAIEMTEEQAVLLREALAAEDSARRSGGELPFETAAILSSARSSLPYLAASSNLTATADAFKNLWASWKPE